MGTLTADCPRLDSHCPHKLATSCRLTSTPNCCACADERAHSRLYRVYIDGVGYVQRGTRWQSYCWFCKEFWNNRLAATDPPLEASQTKIPLIPDQTEFLQCWFEFHQGYRIIRSPGGAESRIAVIGEPWSEVSPGFLPRTLAELRAGRTNDASRPANRIRRQRLASEEESPEEPQQSIENVLDNLLAEASEDEAPATAQQQQQQGGATPPRRPTGPPRPTRVERRLQRARDRFQRLFGSREDIEREDYESPLSTIFDRADARYRRAEELRASGNTTAPSTEGMAARERREIEEQIVWGVMNDSAPPTLRDALHRMRAELEAQEAPPSPSSSEPEPRHPVFETAFSSAEVNRLEEIEPWLRHFRNAASPFAAAMTSSSTSATGMATASTLQHRPRRTPLPPQTLESADRPPPLSDEEMKKSLECQVCYQQIADIAVLPCGHMCMCKWCADVVVPVRHGTYPARATKCPMCRKAIKQRVKIHIGGS